MRIPLIERKPENHTRRLLRRLMRGLDREFSKNTRRLRVLLRHLQSEKALLEAIKHTQRLRTEVRAAIDKQCPPEELLGRLSGWTAELLAVLREQPASENEACRTLAKSLTLLTSTSLRLREAASEPPATLGRRKVVLPADLLVQAHFALLPPERMLVGAGRTENGQSVLGCLFDVTGEHHSAHVRADAQRLARALIATEQSKSFLLAWLHSHPGQGAAATRPSFIDHRQHADWIRDYSENLLSVILTADGYIRFWGTALQHGKIEVEIRGTAVIATEEEHVYRIAR